MLEDWTFGTTILLAVIDIVCCSQVSLRITMQEPKLLTITSFPILSSTFHNPIIAAISFIVITPRRNFLLTTERGYHIVRVQIAFGIDVGQSYHISTSNGFGSSTVLVAGTMNPPQCLVGIKVIFGKGDNLLTGPATLVASIF